MPYELRFEQDSEVPRGPDGKPVPFLGLLIRDEDGIDKMLHAPPGANIFIVEDHSRGDKVHPLVLHSVSLTKLVFRCAKTGCPRQYVYKLSVGHKNHNHPTQR